jgi:ferredoxin
MEGLMTALLSSLEPLVQTLRATGYTVVGPRLRDGAIVLDELVSAEDLPHGWGVRTGPGTYRTQRRPDGAAFAHSTGPQGWKRFLHPPREPLATARRDADGGLRFEEPDEPPVRYAFLGVRPCDLRAIAVQDRVLGVSQAYAARRAATLLVAVNCTEPSDTCFCVSAGGGPDAAANDAPYDLVLTELVDDGAACYIATAGSEVGRSILDALPQRAATEAERDRAQGAVRDAYGRMGRALPAVDLRGLLAAALDSPRWDDVAARCLTCANCTLACPTCFCTSVVDTSDLTGDHAQRWQQWASCFEADFSYMHGGPVRASARSRYRQWLTHKLGTWHDQFGESGCVGCGRCIAWCPAGIDITEEADALAKEVAP